MDLPLARTALDSSRKRRRWILLLAAVGFSGYGAYKVYHLPSVTRKRKKLARVLRTLVSVAEAISSSADTVGLVSTDLNRFLRSDSDEIPTSLKQISKIARSDEFAGSIYRVSEALTVGIVRGVRSGQDEGSELESPTSGSFSERVIDKLFSRAGSGFASVVVGSFAKSLVMAFYSSNTEMDDQMAGTKASLASDEGAVPGWVHLICGDKGRKMIGDCIQIFVSTAVAVFLDKTMDINTYDEFFAGLTNPKHESKVKDMLVLVCNGAVETLIKTTHQVLTSSESSSPMNKAVDSDQEEEFSLKNAKRNTFVDKIEDRGGWFDRVSTTLTVPSNRRFVLDVTGRVTFETVRSFLEFVLWKLSDGARRGSNIVRREIVERGLEILRYISAKSVVAMTVCLALCLHVFAGTRILMPAQVVF